VSITFSSNGEGGDGEGLEKYENRTFGPRKERRR
jgi:hypothetical protein